MSVHRVLGGINNQAVHEKLYVLVREGITNIEVRILKNQTADIKCAFRIKGQNIRNLYQNH